MKENISITSHGVFAYASITPRNKFAFYPHIP